MTYALRVHNFRCLACNYRSRHPVGTPDMDQTLTDVNTEFARYHLFVCRMEQKFIHVDILGASFDGRCPSDSSKLEEVDPADAKCPRCGKEVEVTEVKPLSASDSVTEWLLILKSTVLLDLLCSHLKKIILSKRRKDSGGSADSYVEYNFQRQM